MNYTIAYLFLIPAKKICAGKVAVGFEHVHQPLSCQILLEDPGRRGLCNIYGSCHGSVPVAFYICPGGLRSHSNPASGGLRCIASVPSPQQLSSVDANHITNTVVRGFSYGRGGRKGSLQLSKQKKFNDLTQECVN